LPDTVKVNTAELLERLKENRDGHLGVFLAALAGFHEEVIVQLERALENARAGRCYTTQFRLPEPEDHTRDYDRVIEMLEMSVDEVTELDQRGSPSTCRTTGAGARTSSPRRGATWRGGQMNNILEEEQ
jgi:hypothetical protein